MVEDAFHRKAALGYSEAPESACGRIVGVVGIAVNFKILVVIWTRGMGAGPLENRHTQRGICSGIRNYPGLHSLDDSVLIAAQGHLDVHGMALGVDDETFLSGELHLAGALRKHGYQSAQMLNRDIFLASEGASDIAVLDADLLFGKTEHRGSLAPRVIDTLVRGINPDPSVIGGN